MEIRRITDTREAPDPSKDVTWWAVAVPGKDRPGWAWVSGSVPPPDDEWVVAELHRLKARFGPALESKLLAKGGLQLDAPRADEG